MTTNLYVWEYVRSLQVVQHMRERISSIKNLITRQNENVTLCGGCCCCVFSYDKFTHLQSHWKTLNDKFFLLTRRVFIIWDVSDVEETEDEHVQPFLLSSFCLLSSSVVLGVEMTQKRKEEEFSPNEGFTHLQHEHEKSAAKEKKSY